MKRVAVVFGVCLAFAAQSLNVAAQPLDEEDEEDEDVHPLTNMPLQAEFVNVEYTFGDNPSSGLTMGDRVSVVVGIVNTDPTKEINVTSAMGSLNHPQDFSLYVANFSQQVFNQVTIPPGQECSFTYNFYTPSSLQVDFPYQMALSIFYEDDYELFSDTFHNGTVSFVEPELEWDSKSIVETILLFTLSLGAYLYSNKVWSPQATNFGSGKIDYSRYANIDNSWDAVKQTSYKKKAQ